MDVGVKRAVMRAFTYGLYAVGVRSGERYNLFTANWLTQVAFEPPQVMRYGVGEEFVPHFDFMDEKSPGFRDEIASQGQRIAAFLIYLNEEFEGGETEFPELGLRHRGGRGDALVFRNLDAAGQPDRRTLHAGLAPTAGECCVELRTAAT